MCEETSVEVLRKAKEYLLDGKRRTPFFVALDDGDDYGYFLTQFAHRDGMECLRLHDFCRNGDSLPDIDSLTDRLKETGTGYSEVLLLGVGDAVRLFAPGLIGKLRDLVLPRKLLVPCRSAREVLRGIASADAKFAERQVAFAGTGTCRPVVAYRPGIVKVAKHGVRDLLEELEGVGNESVNVETMLSLKGVTVVRSAYQAWHMAHGAEPFSEEMLSSGQWQEILADDRLEGYRVGDWRTFLRYKKGVQDSESYLSFVAGRTRTAAEWTNGLAKAILDISRLDRRFVRFFTERRKILDQIGWTEAMGAEFAAYAMQIRVADRYAYLTDKTMSERKALLACVAEMDAIPHDLKDNDYRLAEYLRDFHFSGKDSEFWTEYFGRYKRCKVLNRIDAEFLGAVEAEAKERKHWLALPTRGSVLDELRNKLTGLYWLDALGCEYLGYIQARAMALGLSMKVRLVRANLPTLTCYNREFFNDWPSAVKIMSKALDDIKHAGETGFDYNMDKKPIHLAAELDVIDKALDWICVNLKARKVRKILLVSDHGASRLAVIRESETMWEMGTKGEHSGRCCPKDEIAGIPECATEEVAVDGKKFWVLSNYDRFKGGRRASVEVHGGASIEEVAIPLVEFSLGKKVDVRNLTPVVRIGGRNAASLELFSPDMLENVGILIDGKPYRAEPQNDGKKIHVILPNSLRIGEHDLRVFEGDDEIGTFIFKVEGRAARVRQDDFF